MAQIYNMITSIGTSIGRKVKEFNKKKIYLDYNMKESLKFSLNNDT